VFIYRFTNPKTNQQYIGKWCNSVSSLLNRYKVEIKNNENNRYIINALRQIGINNFKFEIIKDNIIDHNNLNILERHFIAFYNTMRHGYNLTEGGEGVKLNGEKNGMYGKDPWNKNKKWSEEIRIKLSESHKGHSPWNKGKKTGPLSEETKSKMNNSNRHCPHPNMKGKEPPNKGIRGIYKHSEETLLKMRGPRGPQKGKIK
jgi:hypothetical protein